LRSFSSISFARKRLWSHRGLAVCLALGLVTAAALSVAVPLYADGVNYNLLNAALTQTAAESRRPPFSFIFHYVGAWNEPIDVDKYQPIDAFMGTGIADLVGLPLSQTSGGVTRYVSTDNLPLYPDAEKVDRTQRIDLVKLAFISGVFDHITLVEGELPPSPKVGRGAGGEGDGGQGVEALVPLKLANDLGLQVGDTYLLYKTSLESIQPYQLRVRVSGIWLPADPADEFWFYPPESFDNRFLLPEETFFGPAIQNLPQPVSEAVWRVAFDGGGVHSEDVPGLLARVDRAQTRANALLPHTDLEFSPMQALRQYHRDALALTGLLFVFSAPVLGLAFYFLGLVAAMLVRRQRNEIAVLRSRGASRRWVALIYAAEWSLLGLVVLLAGPWLGVLIARLVSRTYSFLDFSRPGDLAVRLTPQMLVYGLAVIALALLFSLIPAWGAGRFTIVSYKQERARARQRPWWQRFYLDVLLLLPPLYGLYTLRAQGGSQVLGRTLGGGAWFTGGNPFENPVLFLLPTLFIVGSSLLLLRLLPVLLSGLAWVVARLPGTVPVLAFRHLSRSAADHMAPLMLMVITLSLAGFVASMAHTLDRSLNDNVYYQVGADLNLVEGGEYTGEPPAQPTGLAPPGLQSPTNVQTASDEPAVWNFLPVSDHLALPGVQAVARVGRYDGRLEAGGRSTSGTLIGLDRTDFPAVSFFRRDFASESLGGLMNRLAYDPAALLVDRDTWEQFHLNTGDRVTVQIRIGERHTLTFKVAGVLDYFPTLYPEDGPFFISNLEYIFESTSGLQPYDVWLRTAPDADTRAIIQGINAMGVAVVRVQDARLALESTFAAPSRQGMLGLLSVGFLAAVLLTVVGFLLYALFSFRERFVQLGVLRAIGLSARQMGAYLALEQFIMILIGVAAGTGIAVLAAYLFIPHLPVAFGSHPGTPPFVVAIAWEDIARVYAIFSAMLVLGVGSTILLLRRMKIFQAIKMGENV
jgi:putative ABC transport system permease protein